MRKTFLRTLVVGGVLWVVACADDSTSPTMPPAFDHIPGRGDAFTDLRNQIIALFPEGQARGGRVQSAALTWLRNIDRQLLRSVNGAQGMAFGFGRFGLGQLNAGNLIDEPYPDEVFSSTVLATDQALGELIDALSLFVGGEGGFVVQLVDDGEDTTVLTDDGRASVIIEDEDLTETIIVTIQQIVEESCGLETDLVQSAGCWRFNRSVGDFAGDVEVTVCVEDEDVPPSLLPFLRLHKGEPGEPLQPLVATAGDALICEGFEPLASLGSNSLLNFASAVSGRLRALFGAQPLFASTMSPGARRLGGLTGSFTDFGGVVPFFESFESGIPGRWTSTGAVETSGTTTNIAATDLDEFAHMLTPGDLPGISGGTGGSTLESSSFAALAGDVLTLDFNFLTTDGAGFTDFMFIQMIDEADAVVATLANANTSGQFAQAVPALGGTPPPAISAGVTLSPTTAVFDGVLTGPIGVCVLTDGCVGGGQTFGPSKFGGGNGGSTGFVTSSFTITADGDYRLLFVVQDVNNRLFPSGLAIDNIRLTRPVTTP